MAIAFDAVSAHTSTGTNENFTHTPASSTNVKGVIVFVVDVSSTNTLTGLTYGGTTVTQVTGSPNVKSTGEDGRIACGFLGASVPQGSSITVNVTHSASGTRRVIIYTVTAADDTEVADTDASINSDAVVSPSATLSLGGATCFCCEAFLSGKDNVGQISPFTNWTADDEADTGLECGGAYRYDIIGSTDVTMGWTQNSPADDALCIGIAVNEVAASSFDGSGQVTFPQITINGVADTEYKADGQVVLPMLTTNGVADTEYKAQGTLVFPALTVSGSASHVFDATGNVVFPQLQINGLAALALDGAGQVNLPMLSVTGIAGISLDAAGQVVLPMVSFNGLANSEYKAAGTVTFPSLSITGVAVLSEGFSAAGNPILPALTVNGIAALEYDAQGIVTLPSLIVGGSALAFIPGEVRATIDFSSTFTVPSSEE